MSAQPAVRSSLRAAALSVGPKPGATPIYYARRKAARCLASGWTMDQATGRCSEYGWLRSLDKSPKRPLVNLTQAERRIQANANARARIAANPSQPFDLAGYVTQVFGFARLAA